MNNIDNTPKPPKEKKIVINFSSTNEMTAKAAIRMLLDIHKDVENETILERASCIK